MKTLINLNVKSLYLKVKKCIHVNLMNLCPVFKFYIVSTFLLLHFSSFSEEYIWAKGAGGINSEVGNSVAIDANRNIIVTGYFQSGTITFGSTTLTNSGGYDIFLVKYSSDGNVIWAQNFGGSGDDESKSVAVDTYGNIIITGYFKSSSITFGTISLTNAGAKDIFIVKFSPDGNILWAKSAGGNKDDYGLSVAIDLNENIIVTGSFMSTSINLGTTTLVNTQSGGGLFDIFLVKFLSDGTEIWAQNFGGDGDHDDNDEGYCVNTDANGNIILTGWFSSGSITFGTTTLTNVGNGGYDIFLVKYSPDGNVLWATSAGNYYNNKANSVTVDANGNIILTGYFSYSSITFGTITLTNAGGNDIFIVKYSSDGNVLWAKSAGGSFGDEGKSVTVDANGYIFLTGLFTSSSIAFENINLTNAGIVGLGDILLAKFSTDGNIIWAKSAGGTAGEEGNYIDIDTNGDIIITGSYGSPITFGTTNLTCAGNSDVFVVKLGETGEINQQLNTNNWIEINMNPGNNKLNLFCKNNYCSDTKVILYNTNGEILLVEKILKSKTEIDLCNLSQGMYFIKIFNSKNVEIKKIFKI